MNLNYSGSGIIYYNKTEYKCDLYINKNYGGILINISVGNPFVNFLELPLNMKFLCGELSTGYKFSLINCSREETNGLLSEGRTVFTYYAQYMIEGIGGKECDHIYFHKVTFELSDIIKWGNISGYSIGKNYEIMMKNESEDNIFENENYNIKYIVGKNMLPIVHSDLLKENITLKQTGNIEIAFKEEKDIEHFIEVLEKVKKIIELSTLTSVYLNRITGYNKKIYDIYGESKYERPISIISSEVNMNDNIDKQNNFIKSWGWLTLPELIENNSFDKYFCKYEILEPIMELYLQIIKSREMSSVRVFLNVVQALETYHSRFKANSIKDFKNRITDIILKNRPKEFIESDTKFLMGNSHKFITLESRIADLLIADFNMRFDTGNIKYLDFPNVIANTRNYYIHYDENIKNKGKVLTNAELAIYNRTLLYMLEYYILLELGFVDINQIRNKLNERWGKVSDALTIKKHSEEMANENI